MKITIDKQNILLVINEQIIHFDTTKTNSKTLLVSSKMYNLIKFKGTEVFTIFREIIA